MPQRSVYSGWSADSLDEEARALQQRLVELTADGRMNQAEAMRQIAREDNEELVRLNIEKAAQEREAARKPEAPEPELLSVEPPPPRELIFSEDREPRSENHNLLKQEQADLPPSQQRSSEGRTLSFSEDRERHSPDYNELKRENAETTPSQDQSEGRSLSFAEDRGPSPDHER